MYTENIKDYNTKRNSTANKTLKLLNNSQKFAMFFNPNNSNIKNSENENIEENNKKKINQSTGIKFLIDKKISRKNSFISNSSNISKVNQKTNEQIHITKKKTKKISIDKYTFSDKLYKSQINDYNKYLKSKQIMRGKNFSKQLAILEKEKEKFGIIDNEETEIGMPKLNHTKLLYQMQLKDIFKNSFNSMRVFEEGDQDLDLDNLNKIKKLINEYEIEMAHVLKISDKPSYIKKDFNKLTVGKYQGTRGVYFGK